MNLGSDRGEALKQAYANAKATKTLRYVWLWAGSYWCDTLPPSNLGTAGVLPEGVDVVYPDGHYESYADTLTRANGNKGKN